MSDTPIPHAPLRDAPAPPGPARAAIRIPLVWALALLGAVLYGLHVQDTAMAPLAWVSTVPWLVMALHPRLQGRGNFLAFCVSLQVMAMIGIEWLRGQGTGAWIIAPLLYWPLALPAWFIVRAVRRAWPAFPLALLWGVAWTGVEWLRLQLSPGELALCVLGYSQIAITPLVQVADLAGVAGVSFWLAAAHGLMADVVIALTTGAWRARRRALLAQAAGVAALVGFVIVYGFVRANERHFSDGPLVHVLQPDSARSPDEVEARHIHDLQVMETLSTVRPDTDAILWPENSITVPFGSRDGTFTPYFIPDLKRLAASLKQPILVDGWRHAPELGGDVHTAALVAPDGSVQTYDKCRLLPYTEVVPGRRLLGVFGQGAVRAWEGFIEKFVGIVPQGVLGSMDDIKPFTLRGRDGREWRFGTPICFEIATARVVNRWNRQGVDFLVNQTSEGRLGTSVHETTITISGFRAIEGRVSVVRVTNEGISSLIDPNGRVREVLMGRYTGATTAEPGVFYPRVIIDSRKPTVYAMVGDAFAITCLIGTACLWLAAVVARRRSRRAQGPALAAAAP